MAATVQARVLIVARNDALTGPLAEGLDRLGWRTVLATDAEAACAHIRNSQIEAVIVDLASGGDEALYIARQLKGACAPRLLPVVAVGEPIPGVEAGGFDLTLAAP